MNTDRWQPQLFLYTVYVCLVMGMAFLAVHLTGAEISVRWLTGLLLVICDGIWMFRTFGGRPGFFMAGAAEGICLAAAALTPEVSLRMAVCAIGLAAVCYGAVIRFRRGGLVLGAAAAAAFAGRLFGRPVSGLEIFLLFCFCVGDCAWKLTYRGERTAGAAISRRASESGIAVSAVALAASLFLVSVLPGTLLNSLMDVPVRIQQQIQQRLIQNGLISSDSGAVSRGNRIPTGQERLEVTVSREPDATLYLKNYTAGDYLGNRWAPADETDFYEDITRWDPEGRSRIRYLSPYQFEDRQFEAVRYGQWEEWVLERGPGWDVQIQEEYREWSGLESMAVRELTEQGEERVVPYCADYQAESWKGVYYYSWYPWREYEDYLSQDLPYTQSTYRELEIPYEGYVKSRYLQVPAKRLPGLTALAEADPLTDPEQITAHIRETLWSMASYSQTPGLMPLGRDVAEYFLFEGGEGYCQHFATAAALLYRMYGIPARYVTGYAVPPEQFEERETGSWRAVVTDAQAHAWVEIYLEEAGWVPVDMTPPAEAGPELLRAETGENGTEAGAETGVSPEQAAETAGETDGQEEEETAAQEDRAEAETAGEEGHSGEGEGGTAAGRRTGGERTAQLAAAGALLAAGGVILTGVLFLWRRKKRTPAAAELNRRAERLRRRLGGFPEELKAEEQRLFRAALKEEYGRNGLSEEEKREAEQAYGRLLAHCMGQAGRLERWYLRLRF